MKPEALRIALLAFAAFALGCQVEGTGGGCIPVGERAGRQFGCFVVANQMGSVTKIV